MNTANTTVYSPDAPTGPRSRKRNEAVTLAERGGAWRTSVVRTGEHMRLAPCTLLSDRSMDSVGVDQIKCSADPLDPPGWGNLIYDTQDTGNS